jgi:hypothetical protein
MARVTGPLFSLDARGQLGRAIVYSIWKGINYVRRWIIPENPQSADQTHVRGVFEMGVNAWHYTLSAGNRTAWDDSASLPAGMSGFNWHQSEYMEAMLAGNTPPTTPPS